MKKVRTAARAVIFHGGQILAIEMRGERGPFYILPGGGQGHGETLEAALQRECQEEIGTAVEIERLLYVREYIGGNHDFSHKHGQFHQLEIVFQCRLPQGAEPRVGPASDPNQTGIAWLALADLHDTAFYPRAIVPHLQNDLPGLLGRYIGDVN